MSTPTDEPVWIPDEQDAIRWGTEEPESALVDWAGVPKLPDTDDGTQYIYAAHDAAKRHWHPPREASDFDPTRQGSPPRHFRQTMTPVSNTGDIGVIRNPRARRP